MIKVPRFLVAAAGSGSGKTTVTCGLLSSFLRRGVKTVSFKCGPDYIDPMFHTEVIGVPGRNLDLFFTDRETTRALLAKNSGGAELAIIEGVMGYYDGLAAVSTEASSYDLAAATETPTVLLIDCKGKSVSILAEIKGFLEYKKDSNIKGVLLNRLSPMLYGDLKRMIEEELSVRVYGFLPALSECSLESRHLGLVTAQEVGNLRQILDRLADQMEQTVDLAGLLTLADSAPALEDVSRTAGGAAAAGRDRETACGPGLRPKAENGSEPETARRPRIAVAMDKAFCFYYKDNLELLASLGAEVVPFSPLSDERLPEGTDGLLFGGGYPELYLSRLSENTAMKEAVFAAVRGGMPCVAECGGFMYLHERIVDEDGRAWPMVGLIAGESYPTGKLGRFGYITLTAERDTLLCRAGESVRGHEFHYWDSTSTGDAFTARKPLRKRSWECVVSEGNLFAGYPHLHYWSAPETARRFVEACRRAGRGGA